MLRRARLALFALIVIASAAMAEGKDARVGANEVAEAGTKAEAGELAVPNQMAGGFSFEELPALSGRAVLVLPPAPRPGNFPEYRFSDNQAWRRFTAPVILDAAFGEDRSYELEYREDASLPSSTKTIRIDRRPPGMPRINPALGLYRGGVKVAMTAEEGASIRYAVSGTGSGKPVFAVYDPDRPPSFDAPDGASVSVILVAYALDGAGNASSLARTEYRLASPGPSYDAPPQPKEGPVAVQEPLSSLPPPLLRETSGHYALVFHPPEASVVYVAVNPGRSPATIDDFLPLAMRDGEAILDFPIPLGWSGEEKLFIGLRGGGGFAYRPIPLEFRLSSPNVQPRPAPPSVLESGETGFLVFPPYDGLIRFSLSAGAWEEYAGPRPLARLSDGVSVDWIGLGPSGQESPAGKLVIGARPRAPSVALVGPAPDAVVNRDVNLKPSGPGYLRYELSSDSSIPPEPGPSSPLVGPVLLLSCPEGSQKTFIVRYRSFTNDSQEARGDEGGLLRFTIDRVPPSAPVLKTNAASYSRSPVAVSVLADEGTVFLTVESGGIETTYERAESPFILPGSFAGPLAYRLHAWTVDNAGNRSVDSATLALEVDIATMYVDEAGCDSGDGSRERPFASLDAALALLLGGEKPAGAIELRGRVSCDGTFNLVSRNLAIRGGFDAGWKRDAEATSTIVRMAGRGPLFAMSDADLVLEGMRIETGETDAGEVMARRLFEISGSKLSLTNLKINVSSSHDLLLFDAKDSTIALVDTDLTVASAESATVFEASGSDVSFTRSRVGAGIGVKYYSAASMRGGTLAIVSSVLASRALLGTRLLALTSTVIDARSSLLDLRGGGGFLAVGDFDNCRGGVANCRLFVDWAGGATLFRIRGTSPTFVYDSFFARTRGGSFRFFDCRSVSPILRNCILDAMGERNELVVADTKPAAGDIAANCMWGFSSLVAGVASLADPAALNAWNAPAKAMSAKPNFSESPRATFALLPPDSFALAAGSRCVDAALALEAYPEDFEGDSRPGKEGKPDIGADELRR